MLEDGKQIVFNTGRLYTKEGQIIVVRIIPGIRDVVFHDLSRHIAGYIGTIPKFSTTEYELIRWVMRKYDRFEYSPHQSGYGLTVNNDTMPILDARAWLD